MTSGAAIARLEDVRVSIGAVGLWAQRSGEGVPRPWSELTERERVNGRGTLCSAESVRVKGCISDEGRGLNSFALRKRGEERGDEVGLVLARLAIEAWRIGGDEAGEIDTTVVAVVAAVVPVPVEVPVAVALMWSGDEVTGVCGLRAVDACINEIALGELAGELESRRKEWVDARLEGREGRLGVEANAAVNGTCC